MAMLQVLMSTTGTTGSVTFRDVGMGPFTHPTTDEDLMGKGPDLYSLVCSNAISSSLDAGEITIKDRYGNALSSSLDFQTCYSANLATTSSAGVVQRATQAEVDSGTESTKYVTPATLEGKSISATLSYVDTRVTSSNADDSPAYTTNSATYGTPASPNNVLSHTTPTSGSYLVFVSANVSNITTDRDVYLAVFTNDGSTENFIDCRWTAKENVKEKTGVAFQCIASVDGTQDIELRCKVEGNTAEIWGHNLTILKLT